ncbi:ABC transporter substrate-binding protein [Streptomyces sp. JV185]|uniref:ABC transporter substrate-binding protein n=1 Tax=Streptomyces sp. JV185 TaxID=858638 RepID=UPI002E783304|nr:ABC transporter substrate-binding protein [Streptomyces sp. JV185]MEE1769081.1 ABC transporter substrate-binding protein [Streptomyces sp. JV185]
MTLSACGEGAAGGAAAPAGEVVVAGLHITSDAELHASLPAAVRSSGTVRVATDVPYVPFVMFRTEGRPELTGLDYDLGQALGAKLGVRFAFTAQKFDGIVPAVQSGKFDAVMSAMTDTEERRRVLDFVDYSVSGSGILVVKGNPERIARLDDLCGRKVATQAATHQLEVLKAQQSTCAGAGRAAVSIQTFPKDSDAQLALRSGKVAAELVTKPGAGWTAKTADGGRAFEVVEDPAAGGGYEATPNGIGVSKQLPALTGAIQKALQALIDDGTLDRICDKYGASSIAVKQATKNAAVS